MLAEIKVSRNDAGQKVERYLRKYFFAMSLDRLQSLFRRKEIKIDRKAIDRSYMLKENDLLQVYGLKENEIKSEVKWDQADTQSQPQLQSQFSAEQTQKIQSHVRPFTIPILHEDEDILVLDKPGNLAVHPGTGIQNGESLIEKVWEYLGTAEKSEELFQPALVHRLDKETSGVIVVAKSGESLRRLTGTLRNGGFTKKYLALVEGALKPAKGEITGLIQRIDSREGGAKSRVSEDEGKWSITHYQTLKVIGNFSLLSVIIETGRMHQIRAHLAHKGHPIVGDSRYGIFANNRDYRKNFGLKRTFLHAGDLEIALARGGKLNFHAELSPDLKLVLEKVTKITNEVMPQ